MLKVIVVVVYVKINSSSIIMLNNYVGVAPPICS